MLLGQEPAAVHLPGPEGRDCQVLVVGADPTGLVLAAELLTRGMGTRIIDQSDAAARQTRQSLTGRAA